MILKNKYKTNWSKFTQLARQLTTCNKARKQDTDMIDMYGNMIDMYVRH